MMNPRVFIAVLFACVPLIGQDPCERARAAVAKNSDNENHYYNAACCDALDGALDSAFALLHQALTRGYTDYQYAEKDTDLEALRTDPRWATWVQACKDAEATYFATINRELYDMYQADQSARRGGNIDWEQVSKQDEMRRARVNEILAEGGAKTGDDFYHAAMVFQHGGTAESYERANALALKAVVLGAGGKARWLACAAEDRWLQSLGKPQIWGTQYTYSADGGVTAEPWDRNAKTDAERLANGVSSAADFEAMVHRLDKKRRKKATEPPSH